MWGSQKEGKGGQAEHSEAVDVNEGGPFFLPTPTWHQAIELS